MKGDLNVPARGIARSDDPLARRRSPGVLLSRAASTVLGQLHVTPDFIIVGAARAGTTSILNHMRTHPGILYCPTRELHFFDVEGRWSRGIGSYRRMFPLRSAKRAAIRSGHGPALSGENSPYYLAHPYAAERVRATLPDVRLIALLRDPTDRAISHWNWRLNHHQKSRPFEAIVEEELPALAGLPPGGSARALTASREEVRSSGGITARSAAYSRAGTNAWERRNQAYLARGIYLEQLQRWHAVFPREQLLVLISERYYADPATSLARLWAHMGLPNAETHDSMRNARKNKKTIDPAVVARVREFYRPHNAALAAYLGEQLDWD